MRTAGRARTAGRVRTTGRARAAILGLAVLLAACGSVRSVASDRAVEDAEPAAPPADVSSDGNAPTPTRSSPPAEAAPLEAPEHAAVCGRIERPRLQAGSHLIGDQPPPVPYSSTPPTSGWHSSGHLDVSVRDARDPLSEPEQVSVLEAGGIVVAHGRLADQAVVALGDHVRATLDGRVAVTPYDQLADGQVVFTGWGVLQRCDGVDLAALDEFQRAHGADEPIQPGHRGAGAPR